MDDRGSPGGELSAKLTEGCHVEYEYKERDHEKNNSGAGVGGVTERV